ncbi:mutator protein MutT [Kineothrix alysoides]|uniref:Mutator protein MutT n=1 Tax=Kineothrix alysoides TaxID=1469948 RepID=A0A4R1QV32_9FIRM|nr:NUDIX hydrolase [Kineothrix alysoides]TCL56971.1 mutator protein MutT [Kineothrix alysoides]
MLKIMLCGASDVSAIEIPFNDVVEGFAGEPMWYQSGTILYWNSTKSSWIKNSTDSVQHADICVFVIMEEIGRITWDDELEAALLSEKPFLLLCLSTTYQKYRTLRKYTNIEAINDSEMQQSVKLLSSLESRQLTIISFDISCFHSVLKQQLAKIFIHCLKNLSLSHNSCTSNHFQALGLENYFTSANPEERQLDKREALESSNSIKLLARSGSSFIGSIGGRFRDILTRKVRQQGTTIQVLLVNPWSYYAVLTAFSEDENNKNYTSLIAGTMSAEDIISAYIKSKWYSIKLQDALSSYEQLVLKYPDLLVRFIDFEITASVLLTDTKCYYEPYSNFMQDTRYAKNMSTFEIAVSTNTAFYEKAIANFDMLWNFSTAYDSWKENEEAHRNRLLELLNARETHQPRRYVGVHAIIQASGTILVLKRSKDNLYQPELWDFPGGGIESGETIEEALLREVREETQLEIEVRRVLSVYSNNDQLPFRQTTQIVFMAKTNNLDVVLNSKEHSDYNWMHPSQLQNYTLMPYMQEAIDVYLSQNQQDIV